MFDLPEAIRTFSNDLRKREPHQHIVLALANPHDIHEMRQTYANHDTSLGIGEVDRIVGVNVSATDLVPPSQVQFVIFRNPGWGVDCGK